MSDTKPQKSTDDNKLDVIDRKIIKLVIENATYTDNQIAEKLGLERTTINKRKNSKRVQEEIERLQKSALDEFLDAQKEAVRVGKELLKSDNEHIRLMAFKAFTQNIQSRKLEIEGVKIVYLDKDDANL